MKSWVWGGDRLPPHGGTSHPGTHKGLKDGALSSSKEGLPWSRPDSCSCSTGPRAAPPLTSRSPSPRSLAVGPQYSSLGTQPILCASIPGLVPKQLRFCRNYVEIMPSVAEGVKISIQECQHQFRGRRWNCTTVNNSLAIFGPVLDKGTAFWAEVTA